jgi:hypothetical protein
MQLQLLHRIVLFFHTSLESIPFYVLKTAMFEPKGGKHRVRNWAPDQVPIQAHDHMQYNTFIQIRAQKTIME